ncbi:MSHA biogenesis protein MshJ [Paraferrimonas sedimenticola]|uniref:MSHA biogenesis protein MshJ n=1 Tax=Paraferrimonas sedimenticola TaxID=375674 RepID=A0AA37RYP9_9GAMM|nr:MSHA biogenesis protein MshJ [Paraferrimonas sedimenticola]GLP97394.1 MSHA biogenesis protein MshJ [Paraferrimonas sedimenticola]
MQALATYRHKFDHLSQRERVLIGLSCAVLIFAIGWSFIDANIQDWVERERRAEGKQQEIKLLEQQNQIFEIRLNEDPNLAFEQKLAQIEAQDQAIEEQLQSEMVDMVEPQHMPALLSSVLSSAKGIKLVSFKSLAPIALLDQAQQTQANVDTSAEQDINIYAHGINLTLEGDYFSLLKFLVAVEELPENLYWYELDYQVAKYPKGQLQLEVYSVSMREEFISVASND